MTVGQDTGTEASVASNLSEPERYVFGNDSMAAMLHELWEYRELFYFLAWRDVKVRYKQSVLGIAWAVLVPFLTMVVFTLLFGRLANIPTDGIPGPVFYFSALLPWTYFSQTVTNAGMSLISNHALMTKIYFPRIILPAAVALSGVVDFIIGSLFLAGFIAYYDLSIGWNLLLWPVLLLPLSLLALSIGMYLAALNVKYRDIKYVIPFAIQMGLFITPIIYPVSSIPERYQWLLALNPMTGLIETFRWSLVPSLPVRWDVLGISFTMTLILFAASLVYFKHAQKAFADIV